MSRRKEKTSKIIQTTIQILCKEGSGGLTMRKVAKLSSISLSNLQYYFKDKDTLLEATIDNYFIKCQEDVNQSLATIPTHIEFITLLENILNQALINGNTSEQCSMFREIWALASKNTTIANLVQNYYQHYTQWLVEKFSPYSPNAPLIVSLLMPYIEGYSLMGNALPISKEKVIQQLVKVIQPYCP